MVVAPWTPRTSEVQDAATVESEMEMAGAVVTVPTAAGDEVGTGTPPPHRRGPDHVPVQRTTEMEREEPDTLVSTTLLTEVGGDGRIPTILDPH